MRNTYWLAISTQHGASYSELKRHSVIAQGWPDIDLTDFFNNHRNKKNNISLKQATLKLGDHAYGTYSWWTEKDRDHVYKIMITLASLKQGDLVVGIEGTRVCGICEVSLDGWDSYFYNPNISDYKNTFGGSVNWIDWQLDDWGIAPTPPAQSVKGIKNLKKEKQKVLDIWSVISSSPRHSDELIAETRNVLEKVMDCKIGINNRVMFKNVDGRTGYFISVDNILNGITKLEDIRSKTNPINFTDINQLIQSGWALD